MKRHSKPTLNPTFSIALCCTYYVYWLYIRWCCLLGDVTWGCPFCVHFWMVEFPRCSSSATTHLSWAAWTGYQLPVTLFGLCTWRGPTPCIAYLCRLSLSWHKYATICCKLIVNCIESRFPFKYLHTCTPLIVNGFQQVLYTRAGQLFTITCRMNKSE